jgi:hypothetical protein
VLEPEDETAYHYALLASREKQEAVVKKLKESRMKKKEELGATKKIAKITSKAEAVEDKFKYITLPKAAYGVLYAST